MRILLDTHLLLWALSAPEKLPSAARRQIEAAQVYASVASIWEITIKVGIGKLEADPAEVLAALEPAGFSLLPIVGEHAAKVATLPAIHKDPFDRMLVAQALVEPLILVTNDDVLAGYGEFVRVVS